MTTKLSAAGKLSRGTAMKFWVDPTTLAKLQAIQHSCKRHAGVEPSFSIIIRLATKALLHQMVALNDQKNEADRTPGIEPDYMTPDMLKLRLDLLEVARLSK
jgi:hypothetical protein